MSNILLHTVDVRALEIYPKGDHVELTPVRTAIVPWVLGVLGLPVTLVVAKGSEAAQLHDLLHREGCLVEQEQDLFMYP